MGPSRFLFLCYTDLAIPDGRTIKCRQLRTQGHHQEEWFLRDWQDTQPSSWEQKLNLLTLSHFYFRAYYDISIFLDAIYIYILFSFRDDFSLRWPVQSRLVSEIWRKDRIGNSGQEVRLRK